MPFIRRLTVLLVGTALALQAHGTAMAADKDLEQLAADAYVYGFPLVLMDFSRQVMTAVPRPQATAAPINRFNDSREFPDATFTSVVSPNADTLYSFAWLDLSQEPLVLNLPATGDRYFLMQMLDGWTNVFAAPGTRTTGRDAINLAIVGPNFQGTLPGDLKEIRSPTSLVWLIGRTQTNGKSDYDAVIALKSQYRLIPLSKWGTEYIPPAEVPVAPGVDTKTAPVEQVASLQGVEFFQRLAILLKDNPPTRADQPMVEKLARLGIVPGQPYSAADRTAEQAAALNRGAKAGYARILAAAGKKQGKEVNGWDIMGNVGVYGTDYDFRSVVALVGLGANLPEDAIYPHARVDSDGQPLNGAHRYVIRFPAGQLPPVRAFWSLTMYNSRQFFVENPINRYAIGDRDALKFAADGSLTLYIQQDSPGPDLESNWLPAPADSFNLFMRLYWPKPEIIDGTWKPPVVERVK